MILDNLTRAFKTQNWLAVATEFVIVIAGVVIGFQISQIAQNRAEERQVEELLGLIAVEMEANLETIEDHAANTERHIRQLVFLRGAMAAYSEQTDTQQLNLLMTQAVSISARILALDTSALDQLDDASNRRHIRGSQIEEAITEWREAVSGVRSLEAGLQAFGGIDWTARYPALSLEAVAAAFPSPGIAEAVPLRFETDWAALSQNADLAGRLAVMTSLLEFTREAAERLETSTVQLKDALNDGADL
jgi:hypothetical protein